MLSQMTASSSKLDSGETADKATCGICHRQVSRYTCPSCNLPYCSLMCFRSDGHAQCSEVFYKQELESEIRMQPSASMEERRRMMDMLKKFEEEGGDDDLLNEDDDDDDDNDLANRLGSIDLETASASDLWDALSPTEREAFLSAVRDPGSASAQELLRISGIEYDLTLPWWEVSEQPSLSLPGDERNSLGKRIGKRPLMEGIPTSLIQQPTGPPLLYNICCVLTAYAFVTRHLGASPLFQTNDEDIIEASHDLMRSLVPFITKRSSTLFGSMDDVVSEMWPRLVNDKRGDRTSFVKVLRDAARLLTPRRVVEVDDSENPSAGNLEKLPQGDALLALSDLIALFRSRASGTKETPTTMKLRFYAAHIASLPVDLLAAFSAEVGARARSLEVEGETEVQTSNVLPETQTSPKGFKDKKMPIIEEL